MLQPMSTSLPSRHVASDSMRHLGAGYVLHGTIGRAGTGVRMFVQLAQTKRRRLMWADSVVDFYAFSGNSIVAADRIMPQVARVIQSTP